MMWIRMIRAKNYETLFKFVKVMPRIHVASFFPGHSVYYCESLNGFLTQRLMTLKDECWYIVFVSFISHVFGIFLADTT